MIPSAKSAMRDRPPPENVFSRFRTPPPPNCSCTESTASVLIPGTGTWAPNRYTASMAAVNSSFLRMSATVKALRIVVSIGGPGYRAARGVPPGPALALDDRHGAARLLDRLTCRGAEGVGVDGELLRQLTVGEHLDRDALAVRQPMRLQGVQRDLGARVEAALEVLEVDRLRVRPERLEGHRLLHVRTAQLAHPHVDRHLAALEARAVLRAGARARALLAATRRLAAARALAAAHALARLAAARVRTQRVQPDLLGWRRGPLGLSHRPPPSRDAGCGAPCPAPAACL